MWRIFISIWVVFFSEMKQRKRTSKKFFKFFPFIPLQSLVQLIVSLECCLRIISTWLLKTIAQHRKYIFEKYRTEFLLTNICAEQELFNTSNQRIPILTFAQFLYTSIGISENRWRSCCYHWWIVHQTSNPY